MTKGDATYSKRGIPDGKHWCLKWTTTLWHLIMHTSSLLLPLGLCPAGGAGRPVPPHSAPPRAAAAAATCSAARQLLARSTSCNASSVSPAGRRAPAGDSRGGKRSA